MFNEKEGGRAFRPDRHLMQDHFSTAVLAVFLGFAVTGQAVASDLERKHGFAKGQASAQDLAVLEASSSSEDDFRNVVTKRAQIAQGTIVSTQSGISQGHAQLAASEGLDPTVYSVPELVIIKGESDEDQRARYVEAYRDTGAVISTQSTGAGHVAEAVARFSGPENTRD